MPLRCHLCGEIITCPYEFKGNVYGYTCITKVNKDASKKKIKEHWVSADSYTLELLDSGNTRILAMYKGNYYKAGKFVDFINSNLNLRKNIIIQNDSAFINLYAYKTGPLYI